MQYVVYLGTHRYDTAGRYLGVTHRVVAGPTDQQSAKEQARLLERTEGHPGETFYFAREEQNLYLIELETNA